MKKKIQNNQNRALSLMIIMLFIDFFSFVSAKSFSYFSSEPNFSIPIQFEVTIVENELIDDRKEPENDNVSEIKHCWHRGCKRNISPTFKETSENLIIDIIPILLIGSIVYLKRKDLFNFKYSY